MTESLCSRKIAIRKGVARSYEAASCLIRSLTLRPNCKSRWTISTSCLLTQLRESKVSEHPASNQPYMQFGTEGTRGSRLIKQGHPRGNIARIAESPVGKYVNYKVSP
ncbi:uncharacterized protein [Macrobrachium rosenbergii]|uniref:uncharacterized protein n=1 Tax=Macrobrachium rosenbergii TaxID=79674 RepID=UPI0034D74FB3